jgi:DNA modification methylase
MKIEVSIDLLKDFFASGTTCRHCKYRGTNCIGKSCNDSQIESLIEKSQLILDFDLAILELEKLKKKCTEEQTVGLLYAIEKLEEIKKEFKQ